MEPTECSETSAFNIQTPGKYPEESTSYLQHGKSLKTMTKHFSPTAKDVSILPGIRIFATYVRELLLPQIHRSSSTSGYGNC
jgi:hypothetical protein